MCEYRPSQRFAAGSGRDFATSSNQLSAEGLQFLLPKGHLINIPWPSEWIVLHGIAEELASAGYIFINTKLDRSFSGQEQLRLQLRNKMPDAS